LFSISDINNAAPEEFLPEGVEDEEAPVNFPVRASVTVEKVRITLIWKV
jgi:hypothetical protein